MNFLMKFGSRPLRLFTTLILASLTAAELSSCKKDVENTSPIVTSSPTVIDVLNGSANYSILSAALQKTNLTALLSSATPYTLLAPNDAAFAQLGTPYNSAASIAALNPATPADATQITALQNILLYHIVAGKYRAAELPTGGTTSQRSPSASTRRDNQLFFTRSSTAGSSTLINGVVPITQPDIEASNGFVQGISQVLLNPGLQTISAALTTTAASTTNRQFSLFLQALQRPAAASLLSQLATDVSSTGQVTNYTVFAPSDAAFQAYLTSQGYKDVSQVPNAVLTALLQRHIVPSRVFASQLSNGQTLTSLAAGTTLTIGGTGPFTVSSSATNTANIAATNTLSSNGIIYLIDKVL